MKRFSGLLITRWYSSQVASKAKSPLAVLRQKTGLPIGKCREALTKHSENLEAAEKWLNSEAQKEGWAKVEKLKDRTAHQGLIGMLVTSSSNQNQALMVEVNCETDFVARTDKFKELTSNVTRTTFHQKATTILQDTPMPVVDYLSKDLISSIPIHNQTLADKVAENVGQLGENISISRGCVMAASQGLICGFVYNNVSPAGSDTQLGTYGAILHMLPSEENRKTSSHEQMTNVGQQICQHVVGMDVGDAASRKDLISVLLEQSFLFDSSVTVGELLAHNGLSVTRIIRYALGESDSLF